MADDEHFVFTTEAAATSFQSLIDGALGYPRTVGGYTTDHYASVAKHPTIDAWEVRITEDIDVYLVAHPSAVPVATREDRLADWDPVFDLP